MLSKVSSATVNGTQAVPISVETDISRGMPAFHIVGQADTMIKEAKERLRSAILNTGLEYPKSRITVNMSPAGIRKSGSHFDLAIAMGILVASRQVATIDTDSYGFIGELSLDGTLHKTDGVLPMVMAMKQSGVQNVVIPCDNFQEAALVHEINLYPASCLGDLVDHFNLRVSMAAYRNEALPCRATVRHYGVDFAQVKGQESAKRAMTIAVAGGHGILMMGSPATGKSMLAERIPTIMPEMSYDEMLETSVVYSVAGLLSKDRPYIATRPFRQPHCSITPAGLLGGGMPPKPGEITLASKGVLFLDEAGEFDRQLIDGLRTPLEKKEITLVRCGGQYVFPADFLLVAASNPCKCGYYGDPSGKCTCSDGEVSRYQRKLSGPILDRIDMKIELQRVAYEALKDEEATTSAQMGADIRRAREIQRRRYADLDISLNHQLTDELLDRYCVLGEKEQQLLSCIYDKLSLNPRTLQKVRKVARTIADLDGEEQVEERHLMEALQYRERKSAE